MCLVGFTVGIYYDARTYERQKKNNIIISGYAVPVVTVISRMSVLVLTL